jgi:predicted TPR repeat methyltransferase
VAIRLLPDHPEPLWLLAETLRRLNREPEAIEAYSALLAQDPGDRFGAGLILARLGEGAPPAKASDAHVSALYDQYAGSFDQDLLTRLDYRGPDIILDGLKRAGILGPCDILDIGCGTGLAGAVLKPLARRLDGVDLSGKMAEQARARGVYDRIEVGDLLAFLAAHPGDYDLVVAADVLIHLGELGPLFAAAGRALRPGGSLAFTVERSAEAPIALQPTGRFAHSASYLRQAALDNGFSVRLLEPTATRRERGEPVAGLLCVVSRP